MFYMARFIMLLALAPACHAQNVVRWSATTGNISLSAAGTTATIQQPASGADSMAADEVIEQIVVYCSQACVATQYANGTAATATTGTVTPLLPTPLNFQVPLNFFTSSNVGTGTQQGPATNIGAGSTVVLCLAQTCLNGGNVTLGHGGGTAANWSVVIGSVTATVNITMIGHMVQ